MDENINTLTDRKGKKRPEFASSDILFLAERRQKDLKDTVVNHKKTKKQPPHNNGSHGNLPLSRADLIRLTEKLAADAKNGTLHGLGGFADYGDGYIFGLEGSYLLNPSSAALPLLRLQRRITDQLEKEDPSSI